MQVHSVYSIAFFGRSNYTIVQMKKSMTFIIFTCMVSWAIAGAAILLGIRTTLSLAYTVFAALYMFLPAICSIIIQIMHKEKPFRNLGISFRFNRWFIIAGMVPILYSFMALGVTVLFPNTAFSATYEGVLSMLPAEQAALAEQQLSRFPPVIYLLLQIFGAIVAGYTVNAVAGFGEELGWRGFLLKSLSHKKFLPVSLIIGTVWGLWHFPLILIGHNYPQHPVIGVGLMTIFCIVLTPMMIYMVIKSKSVITAAIFHGTNNAIAGISILYIVGGNDITNGVTGIAGIMTLLLCNFGFYIYDKYITKEHIFTNVIGEYYPPIADMP